MKKLSTSMTIVIGLVLIFGVHAFITPSFADAEWISHYDDYPGEDDIPWGTIIVVGVVGGLACVGIALLITKDNKKDKEMVPEDETPELLPKEEKENSDSTEVSIFESDSKIMAKLATQDLKTSKFNLYLDVDQGDARKGLERAALDLQDMTVKAGLSYSF